MSKLVPDNQKKFTENNIMTLKATLEKRYRLKLVFHRLNIIEVFLMCQNSHNTNCTFIYFFRKCNGSAQVQNYALVFNHLDHTHECNQTKKAIERNSDSMISQKDEPLHQEQYSNEKIDEEHNIHDSIEFDVHHNPESHSKEQKKPTQSNMESFEDNGDDLQGQYYRQEELGTLKKILVHKYSALVSKSTHQDPVLKVVTKISFRCKNAHKINCPFLIELNLVPESQTSPLYQLDAKSTTHTSECIMDHEDLRYHQMTKKIDDSMEILERIVRKLAEGGDQAVRPKLVLETLALQLGEENGDFIYEGLDRRNNRRAVKKYFDNAVGKIRSKQKFQL